MTDNELFEAMRFGSVKNQEREKNDLGRFGLGLKTASFSQCKKLTVISKKGEEINGSIWDLDEITKHQSWKIEKLSNIQIRNVRNIDKLFKFDSGTLVMWEKFDTLSKEITILDSMFDALSFCYKRS